MSQTIIKPGTPEFSHSENLISNSADSTATAGFRLDARRSLRMHRGLATAVGLLVLIAVAGYALTRKTLFQAESDLYIEPVKASVMPDNEAPLFDAQRYDSLLQQQMQVLQRRDVLEAAIAKLPEGVWRHAGEPLGAAAARMSSGLKAERQGNSFQIAVTLTGPDADDTPRALNALIQQFLAEERKEEGGSTAARLELLVQEKSSVQEELRDAREQQNALNASLGIASLGKDSRSPLDEQMDNLRTQLAAVRREHDLAAAQLAGASDTSLAAEDLAASDSSLATLKANITQRKSALQAQMTGMTQLNPIYKQNQQEIVSLDRQLNEISANARGQAVSRVQNKLRMELRRTSDLEALLNQQIAQQSLRAVSAGPSMQHASEIANNIDRLQTRLSAIEDAMRSSKLEVVGPARIRVQVPAGIPAVALPGKRNLMLVAALPLAFLCALFAAVAARKMNGRVYIADDVKATLGFPPLVVMPLAADVSDAVEEEYFLRLAAGIEAAYQNSSAKSFVFTAVNPETEIDNLIGKVQRKLRDLGYAPLWISAETLLRAERDFEKVHGRISGVIRFSDRGNDGLAAARLEWLKHNYDMVLIDAEPILHSAEAEYAVRRTDATILVTESGVAMIRDLKDSAMLLQRLNATGVGVVVQDLKLEDADPAYKNRVQTFERRRASAVRRRKSEETPSNVFTYDPHYEDTSRGGDADFLHRITPISRQEHAPQEQEQEQEQENDYFAKESNRSRNSY